MKKYRLFCLLVCISLILSTGSIPVWATPVNDMSIDNCSTIDAPSAYLGPDRLVEGVGSVFLYEKTSDTLMYAWNPDEPVYPSSIVKVLTAYMAVELGNPTDPVTVTEEVLAGVPFDAVTAELQVGEQLTLEDLIYCMLVGSANDAASVIAAHIGGTEAAFVEKMNAFVQDLGCTGTVLKNPHGLHDPQQVSTVRDLAKIVSAASENETFMTYLSTTEYVVPATNLSEERRLASKNFLMTQSSVEIYYDSRVSGSRTGIANDGSRCLASVAEDNGLKLVCIVMGAQDTFAENGNTLVYGGFKETTFLLDTVFEGYGLVQVLYKGQSLRQCAVSGGDCDMVVGPTEAVSAILPKGVGLDDLSFRYSNHADAATAPVENGQNMGTVAVWYGSLCIAEADLCALNSVSPDSDVISHGKGQSNGSGVKRALAIIVLIVIIAICVFIGIRIWAKIRLDIQNGRSKKYRRDRRRSR